MQCVFAYRIAYAGGAVKKQVRMRLTNKVVKDGSDLNEVRNWEVK